ncbi:MAG TPA: YIP1 family protein [Chthoniobacterales bacterium]|nr:YIP1 family protein [Chthoniobacterales bacterium]
MIHVNRGATSLGTFPEEKVREGIRASRFLPSDLGWREGMASWQPLSQFSEFADDIAAAPAASAPPPQTPTAPAMIAPDAGSTSAPRSGLPWDERHSKGLFSAFIETLQMVLSKPGAAFTAMRREGGLGEPLLFGLIGGSFGFIVYFIYNLAFQSLGMFANRNNPLTHLIGAGIGGIVLIVCAPLFVLLGIFIGSAILHLCLLLVGGAKQSFETTFRVVCFAGGSVNPLLVIPFCGGLIVSVWKIVLYCIGLARAHETDTGRAVLAVFLPLILCCGGVILCAMLFGGIGAMMHNWNP